LVRNLFGFPGPSAELRSCCQLDLPDLQHCIGPGEQQGSRRCAQIQKDNIAAESGKRDEFSLVTTDNFHENHCPHVIGRIRQVVCGGATVVRAVVIAVGDQPPAVLCEIERQVDLLHRLENPSASSINAASSQGSQVSQPPMCVCKVIAQPHATFQAPG